MDADLSKVRGSFNTAMGFWPLVHMGPKLLRGPKGSPQRNVVATLDGSL